MRAVRVPKSASRPLTTGSALDLVLRTGRRRRLMRHVVAAGLPIALLSAGAGLSASLAATTPHTGPSGGRTTPAVVTITYGSSARSLDPFSNGFQPIDLISSPHLPGLWWWQPYGHSRLYHLAFGSTHPASWALGTVPNGNVVTNAPLTVAPGLGATFWGAVDDHLYEFRAGKRFLREIQLPILRQDVWVPGELGDGTANGIAVGGPEDEDVVVSVQGANALDEYDQKTGRLTTVPLPLHTSAVSVAILPSGEIVAGVAVYSPDHTGNVDAIALMSREGRARLVSGVDPSVLVTDGNNVVTARVRRHGPAYRVRLRMLRPSGALVPISPAIHLPSGGTIATGALLTGTGQEVATLPGGSLVFGTNHWIAVAKRSGTELFRLPHARVTPCNCDNPPPLPPGVTLTTAKPKPYVSYAPVDEIFTDGSSNVYAFSMWTTSRASSNGFSLLEVSAADIAAAGRRLAR